MKIKFKYIVLVALVASIASCKKDNYAAPSSQLSGRLVYKGEPIGVEQFRVPYEIYQYGFGLVGPIGSSFAQDGSYSALLFDGEYKFIIPNNQGPFLWNRLPSGAPNSLAISLKGSKTLDLEVMPFYMLRNVKISNTGTAVNANFKLEKIITDANARDIERVSLYINKTQFVSGNGDQRIALTDMNGSAISDVNSINLSVNIPTIVPTQNYVFARVGVKIAGVEDMLLSPVVKLTF